MSTEKVKPGDESTQPGAASAEAFPVVDNQAGDFLTSVGAKVDDTLACKESIDLGIDWDSLDKESLFASMETFDNAENLYPKVPGKRNHDTYLLHSAELSTHSGAKVTLSILKVISPNFHEMQIEIIRPDLAESMPSRYVADFDFLQRKNGQEEEWDMKHRQTGQSYRRQGIAEKMIDLTGEILKKRSELNGLPQSISSKAIQRDLIEWLRKRGFVPATAQDVENLRRIEKGDKNLLEISKFGETYIVDLNEISAKFGGTLPDLNDPKIWDNASFDNPFYHMNLWQDLVFTVKMKKSI